MKSHWKQFIKKILISLSIVFIYQLCTHISLPGINYNLLSSFIANNNFSYTRLGVGFFSIFALNLGPYLSATIITQILTSYNGIEYFKQMKNNITFGQAQLNTFTQFLTIGVCFIQSNLILNNIVNDYGSLLTSGYMLFLALNSIVLTGGSMFVIWLSNQVSSRGIGNGVQLILFLNLLMSVPNGINHAYKMFMNGSLTYTHIGVIIAFVAGTSIITLFMENLVRKIKIHYPSIKSDHQEYLPLKVNIGGVLHVILANHIMRFIPTVINILRKVIFTQSGDKLVAMFQNKTWLYYTLYSILILFFNIIHSNIVFDPINVSKDLQRSGRVIDGVAPLTDTVNYLKNIIIYLNCISSVYLIAICIGSEILCGIINSWIGADVINISGVTILIGVGITQLLTSGMKEFNYNNVVNQYMRKNSE